jgi:hypothetical protein
MALVHLGTDEDIPDESLVCLLLGRREQAKGWEHPDTHHGLLLAILGSTGQHYRRVGYVEISARGNGGADIHRLFYQNGKSHVTVV